MTTKQTYPKLTRDESELTSFETEPLPYSVELSDDNFTIFKNQTVVMSGKCINDMHTFIKYVIDALNEKSLSDILETVHDNWVNDIKNRKSKARTLGDAT